VEAELPLDGEATARIHASFAGQPAALYEIEAALVQDGELWIELLADRARCKAAEHRGAGATGGCCGTGDSEGEREPAQAAQESGCGCAPKSGAAVACCA
jgi:hypothetical protein